MYLTRHQTEAGARWAADGRYLPAGLRLSSLLCLPAKGLEATVASALTGEPAQGALLAPIDPEQEVWASGVTYLRSREARVVESETKDIYEKVYDAGRVELFFKAAGWRVRGPGQRIRVRRDSAWNVPEPELTLVMNAAGEIVGHTAGNDVSSRDIEGENPLYLPQAKVYDGSCALGPGILLGRPDAQARLPIRLRIARGGQTVFDGATDSGQLKRTLEELAEWLYRELAFPHGAFLLTGTGVVPPDDFNLAPGDRVQIEVGNLSLENEVSD